MPPLASQPRLCTRRRLRPWIGKEWKNLGYAHRQTTYVVMDYYPTTLQSLVDASAATRRTAPYGFSPRAIGAVLLQLCRAVTHLQRHCVVHRDIKADNVFVSEGGRVCIGDFGCARWTARDGSAYRRAKAAAEAASSAAPAFPAHPAARSRAGSTASDGPRAAAAPAGAAGAGAAGAEGKASAAAAAGAGAGMGLHAVLSASPSFESEEAEMAQGEAVQDEIYVAHAQACRRARVLAGACAGWCASLYWLEPTPTRLGCARVPAHRPHTRTPLSRWVRPRCLSSLRTLSPPPLPLRA